MAAQTWDAETISSLEIIIADQNPAWPAEFQERKSTFAEQDNICWMTLETPGVVNARNSAVENSNGEILIFLDDDVRILNRHFLERHVANYRDPDVSSVSGRELSADELEHPDLPSDDDLPGHPESAETPIWSDQPAVFHALYFGRVGRERYQVHTFCTCNGSIRRSEFLRADGFDENFSGNSYGDDYDLAIRLAELGGKLIYDPQAALIHLQSPMGGLRLKDRRNSFSEKEKAISAWLFYLRHAQPGCRWFVFRSHLLRKTVLLKGNLIRFWRQPRVWWGVWSAYWEANRRVKSGPVSRFQT
ncbi:MAG: glycosyltransferase [Planctomycetaceae bacterium]|nr:glycosyltransferase [Planctomycetaceae bacterium]